jgi:hypothetical protein
MGDAPGQRGPFTNLSELCGAEHLGHPAPRVALLPHFAAVYLDLSERQPEACQLGFSYCHYGLMARSAAIASTANNAACRPR